MAGKYSAPVNVRTTADQRADLDRVERATLEDQADIVRACLAIGLPLLEDNPSLIPLLQPGVLNKTPK